MKRLMEEPLLSKMVIGVYCRVSSETQKNEGESLITITTSPIQLGYLKISSQHLIIVKL